MGRNRSGLWLSIAVAAVSIALAGLYAVGNNAGSFYGMVYPPQIEGSGIGHAHTFAYIAAKHAAAQPNSGV